MLNLIRDHLRCGQRWQGRIAPFCEGPHACQAVVWCDPGRHMSSSSHLCWISNTWFEPSFLHKREVGECTFKLILKLHMVVLKKALPWGLLEWLDGSEKLNVVTKRDHILKFHTYGAYNSSWFQSLGVLLLKLFLPTFPLPFFAGWACLWSPPREVTCSNIPTLQLKGAKL